MMRFTLLLTMILGSLRLMSYILIAIYLASLFMKGKCYLCTRMYERYYVYSPFDLFAVATLTAGLSPFP
jgi:hypothetical protein